MARHPAHQCAAELTNKLQLTLPLATVCESSLLFSSLLLYSSLFLSTAAFAIPFVTPLFVTLPCLTPLYSYCVCSRNTRKNLDDLFGRCAAAFGGIRGQSGSFCCNIRVCVCTSPKQRALTAPLVDKSTQEMASARVRKQHSLNRCPLDAQCAFGGR